MFNPEDFKRAVTTQEGSTTVTPCPKGDHVAKVDKVTFRQSQGKKDPSQTYTFGDISYEIDSDEVRRICEREKVTVRQSISIDLSEDGASLDMGKGKNVGLNRVRDAVGQNVAGKDWYPDMLEGKVLRIKVSHRPDERDPSILYGEVVSVGKL